MREGFEPSASPIARRYRGFVQFYSLAEPIRELNPAPIINRRRLAVIVRLKLELERLTGSRSASLESLQKLSNRLKRLFRALSDHQGGQFGEVSIHSENRNGIAS